jgi:hypothetical protein
MGQPTSPFDWLPENRLAGANACYFLHQPGQSPGFSLGETSEEMIDPSTVSDASSARIGGFCNGEEGSPNTVSSLVDLWSHPADQLRLGIGWKQRFQKSLKYDRCRFSKLGLMDCGTLAGRSSLILPDAID